MIRHVAIEFADPRIKASDCSIDISKAVYDARANLLSKYNVIISTPKVIAGRVIVDLDIPDEIVKTFSIGGHLRGIARHLGSSPRYSEYYVGNRLLNYTIVSKEDLEDTSGIYLDLVSSIINLIKIRDYEKLEAIIDILKS